VLCGTDRTIRLIGGGEDGKRAYGGDVSYTDCVCRLIRLLLRMRLLVHRAVHRALKRTRHRRDVATTRSDRQDVLIDALNVLHMW
jgi:hypothetical protein